MKNIWAELDKPLYILAPMDGVTNPIFRQIIDFCGRPDIFFTEFTNVEGLFSKGRNEVIKRLRFTKSEKPIIAQVWGTNPDRFYNASKLISNLGFDGIDINMGCPDRSAMKQGACAALIDNHLLAEKIIDSVKRGAGKLPVSVKTRIGTNKIDTANWFSFLLSQNLSAITVHLRTAKEMSKVPAHWDEIEKIVKLRDKLSQKTIIIGNGDLKNINDANEKINKYGIDGVMFGRAIFQNPWLFNKKINILNISVPEKINLLKKHIALFKKLDDEKKQYDILKKYYKIYINNFAGSSHLREKLMNTKSPDDVNKIIGEYMTIYR